MSLILEALRKSEAERRRGQVPDLHADPAPGALRARDGPPAWLWLALALVTAIVLAMALWLARSTWSGQPQAMETPADATGVPEVASVAPGSAAVVTAEPVSTVDLLPGGVDQAQPAPAAAPLPERTMRVPEASAVARSTPATPSAVPSPRSATADATVPAPRAASPVLAPPRPELPVAAMRAATVAPTAVASNDVASVDAAAATLPSAPAGSAPLRLSDLAVAERRQLPPLKMSMHLWAPTQRFAIIDGARVSEGDRLGDAVVEEITADGVVLAWKGQRLRIPTR